MVIVEYCQFGNLQHFLAKHRYHFIDQIQRDTDMIDSTITNRYVLIRLSALSMNFIEPSDCEG